MAIGSVKPGAMIAQQVAYKSVNVNAPAGVPKPPTPVSTIAKAQEKQAPQQETSSSWSPSRGKAMAAAGVAAGTAAGLAAASSRSSKANPVVSLSGKDTGMQSKLGQQVSSFQDRYRTVEVRNQPTTSGWTWLFLAWALSNSGENHRLEAENRAMKDRMAALEGDLKKDHAQWQQLQRLSQGEQGDDGIVEEGVEEGRDGVTTDAASPVESGAGVGEGAAGQLNAFGTYAEEAMSKLLPLLMIPLLFWIGFRVAFARGYD